MPHRLPSDRLDRPVPGGRPPAGFVDPRGPRFGAWVTTAVLAAVLLTAATPVALYLLLAQGLVFAVGAAFGLAAAPYGWLFRRLVRPRLGPPAEWEAQGPPRFAQGVGAFFAVLGVAGFAFGLPALGLGATAAALLAAFLNAAFGFCLGCEMHLLIRRAVGRAATTRFVSTIANNEGATA